MIRTADLPDVEQRKEAIETMGVVIGTAGTSPYVHLQLEVIRRMFGNSMPTLIVNDGPADSDLTRVVDAYPFARLKDFNTPLGHTIGDIRVFTTGFEWAKDHGIDIVVKLSRRFVPLRSWRHDLQALVADNPNVAMFTRRHNDRADGLFRTDAIAVRVQKLDNPKTWEILSESLKRSFVNVEPLFESFARMNGGWAMWNLLGPNFYRPYASAMQWRGLLPYHYGDLARELSLPYTDEDFASGRFKTDIISKYAPASQTGEIIAPPV